MLYIASSKSQMTDIEKYYVYTGTEEDMVRGFWYYWAGDKWLIGGEYECGIDDIPETDSALNNENLPANAKVVGQQIAALSERIDMLQQSGMLVEGVTITPVQSVGTRFGLSVNVSE